ncbi:hypothetical protein [Acinetobacter baumannii]|uniref:hypothetical protein n=1 Tax=Acinetobacter baumannii TaxID=470 RepID=UPI0034CDC33A
MAVPHTTVLSLLGKEVSFSVLLDDQIKSFFPQGIQINGCVQEVIIALNGNHQILVDDEFYELSRIDLFF